MGLHDDYVIQDSQGQKETKKMGSNKSSLPGSVVVVWGDLKERAVGSGWQSQLRTCRRCWEPPGEDTLSSGGWEAAVPVGAHGLINIGSKSAAPG